MGYVLVPGDVYPRRPVLEASTASLETVANINTRSGVHLLATCKQAHQEGHTILYSHNTFHLPPTMTFSWSDRLLAKHKAMIKRISIAIGLVELTTTMVTAIQNEMPASVRDKDGHRWGGAVGGALIETWYYKLDRIADWDSLEEIEIRSFGRTYLLQHREIVANGRRSITQLYCDPCWKGIFQRSYFYAFANIMTKVSLEGWEVTKEWLRVRKPGEMAERFLIGAGD